MTYDKFLIDGDVLAYISSSSVQKDICWGDDLWTCHAYLSDAVVAFEELLDNIKNDLKELNIDFDMSKVVFTFSDTENFRKEVDSTYKGTRAAKRKPTCYRALVNHIKEHYQTQTYPRLEGDDVIGILATSEDVSNPLIISIDKDMKTLPCDFYQFETKQLHHGDQTTAVFWHFYQTLKGDLTDGYKGCPSYGDVKATKVLTEHCDWDTVKTAFIKAGLTEEDALTQARLAYILQAKNYNKETGEITLWNPTL